MTEFRRALFLLPTDRMGGAEQIVRLLAREAARSKLYDLIEVFVLCRNRSGTLDSLEMMGNVRLYYTGARTERGGVRHLIGHLSRGNFALVFSSATHLNALCSLLRRLGVLKTQRLVARESTAIFDRDFGSAGLLFRALYLFYGAQDIIVCQTQRMRDSFERNTGGRFHQLLTVIPNPIDFERIVAGRSEAAPIAVQAIPENRVRIIWCGRLAEVKSPLRAIDTLRELHDRGHTDMHLVIVGDGPMRSRIQSHIAKQQISSFVTLTGHLPNPVATMTNCQIGLLTSNKEGFPNVVLEMLTSGMRAVVTTDCAGGLTELKGVHVSLDMTASELASTILRSREGFPDPTDREMKNRDAAHFLTSILTGSDPPVGM